MTILAPLLIAGVGIGLLYGLLGAAAVLLFKSTGIVNFAEGRLGAFLSFPIYLIGVDLKWPIPLAIGVALVLAVLLGQAIYWGAIRPNPAAGALNTTIRTLALFLLLYAVMNFFWGVGQPFYFPVTIPQSVVVVLGVRIPVESLVILGIAGSLVAAAAWFFAGTDLGLQFRAVAERPDVAALLGVNVRSLSGIAWSFTCVISLIVGVIVTTIRGELTSDAMDVYLLYGFAAAIIGGLTSLEGSLVGGIVIGIVSSLATGYADNTVSSLILFGTVVLILLVRPNGLFGAAVNVRL